MRQSRYLNAILTIIAVLLSLQLWTQWTAGTTPPVLPAAYAQGDPGGFPNAAAQRREMTDLLKKISKQLSDLQDLLNSGKVRVRVEAAPAQPGRP